MRVLRWLLLPLVVGCLFAYLAAVFAVVPLWAFVLGAALWAGLLRRRLLGSARSIGGQRREVES